MNTQKWNSIDSFEENFPLYNCAYLDILGYKDRVADYFGIRFNLFGRISRALEKAQALHGMFMQPYLDTSNLTVEIVSDSIIILQPCSDNQLGAVAHMAALFSSILILERLPLRGGIARGRHTEKKFEQGFKFVASEALQRAYALEQKAIFPRILIQREIMDDLTLSERSMILREGDEYILDFARYVINRDEPNHDNVHAEMSAIMEMMNSNSDIKVKAKYQWLLDYYYWTISQNPRWDSSAFKSFASCRFSRL